MKPAISTKISTPEGSKVVSSESVPTAYFRGSAPYLNFSHKTVRIHREAKVTIDFDLLTFRSPSVTIPFTYLVDMQEALTKVHTIHTMLSDYLSDHGSFPSDDPELVELLENILHYESAM